MKPHTTAFVVIWLLPVGPAFAQRATAGRQLTLAALQHNAVDSDPRTRELALQEQQSALRQRNISAERLPAVAVEGTGQYQSDVPTAPFTLPNGQPLFSPPKTTLDGHVQVQQRLYDPSLSARSALERAQLDENQARVQTALYAQRQMVNDAFFAAALLQQRAEALDATIADLEARLREAETRAREGAALASDAAAVEATLLQRRQDASAIRADRRAALARLSRLTGSAIAEADVLVLPDTAAAVADARRAPDDLRSRPEYTQFSRSRERIAQQQSAATAQELPRVSAFARVGYSRPGLNFISDQFETYGLGGVQLQWTAWSWGVPSREREALALQQQIVDADQAAFTRSLGEAIEGDLASIDRLRDALKDDDRIVALRESIERTTKARLDEGVVTAADYLERSAELLQARINRVSHEVELAQAGARILTTLGIEVKP